MLKPKLAVTYNKKAKDHLKPDFKDLIKDFNTIPELTISDEELGSSDLLRILPETW